MTRLPFRLKEYDPRITWGSQEARDVWEPRIQRISNGWIRTEREAVKRGTRPATLQMVPEADLSQFVSDRTRERLVALPVARATNPTGYASAEVAGPYNAYKVIVTTPERVTDYGGWEKFRDDQMGELLGYPACCREFFQRVWNEERLMDTTWAQREGSRDMKAALWGTNVLWRWHGVRAVSHLPCSFNCEESGVLAAANLKAMEVVDPDAAFWLYEMLHWPVLWTSLHGIGEITTPIFRFHVASDAFEEKLEVKYHGERYPVEGAKGHSFPHRRAVTMPQAAPLVLARPNRVISNGDPAHNGFKTHGAMNSAHAKLLAALPNVTWGGVLDLGCGDGTLLTKISAKKRDGVLPMTEGPAAVKAVKNGVGVWYGDCTNREWIDKLVIALNPDLIVAQNQRNPPEQFHGRAVLSYNYDTGYVQFFPAA